MSKRFDYEQWRKVCSAAYIAAKLAAQSSDDGGTCNVDSTFISFEGATPKKIIAIAQEESFSCFYHKWRLIGRTGYLISTGFGQGAKNTCARDAAQEAFKKAGYYVLAWDQMD